MVGRTQSAMAVAARADILEFELANHPLDCPVCDKGGECPLQDFTFRHGYPTSRIDGPRLHFKKPIPLSNNIALDRERCVLCYRCTRYYDEVAWEQELTTDERGVQSFLTSQFDQPLQSVFSGNIIDLCPVGALTSRVWRFESRPWDMTPTETSCSKCAVGCSVTQWQRRGQLVRVTSHENDDIDEGWICDRGRFDYTDVNDPSRLRTPSIRGARATWADAINAVAAGIKGKGARLGISLPQDITNEEAFLFRRLLDGPLKGAKVKMHGRTAIAAPDGETMRIKEIDDARVIVVVASDLENDVPIIDLRVKKAVGKRGAKLIVVYPDGVDFDRSPQTVHIRNAKGAAAAEVRKLASHELLQNPGGLVAILFGDGRGSENMNELATACGALAEKVGGKEMPLCRATNEPRADAGARRAGTPMSQIYNDPIGHWVVVVVAMTLLLFVVLTATAYTVWFERVALGRIQRRPGPNRVGPFGLMQLAADGIKLAFKESFVPAKTDKIIYVIAPAIGVAAAFLAWSVIPIGLWYNVQYWIADVNVGILVIFAVSSLNVYAIVLGGYASNNKYSLLGGLRSAAQLISYEMALGLALVPTFMIAGSLRLRDIAAYTVSWGPYHGPIPLIILTPIGFLIYLISATAETNRTPFDLPEAEQELIGGFLTEYSGLKFTMYYLAEYLNVITVAALATLLFFGGWYLWVVPPVFAFFIKVVLVVFLYIWLRGTYPRLRYDTLMRLGWKVLLPLALANVVVTAIVLVAVQG